MRDYEIYSDMEEWFRYNRYGVIRDLGLDPDYDEDVCALIADEAGIAEYIKLATRRKAERRGEKTIQQIIDEVTRTYDEQL